jgi:hypothetical protein
MGLILRDSTLKRRRLVPVLRAVIEAGFIVFLFYSNLLMGEFTHANERGKTFVNALYDVVTPANFAIAMSSALVGYLLFEYLRKRL